MLLLLRAAWVCAFHASYMTRIVMGGSDWVDAVILFQCYFLYLLRSHPADALRAMVFARSLLRGGCRLIVAVAALAANARRLHQLHARMFPAWMSRVHRHGANVMGAVCIVACGAMCVQQFAYCRIMPTIILLVDFVPSVSRPKLSHRT